MFRYFLNKLLLIVPTLIGITICAFGFVRLLPGDPILALAGEHGVTAARYEQLKIQFGFDRPIWEQYFNYVWNVLHGDFGTSIGLTKDWAYQVIKHIGNYGESFECSVGPNTPIGLSRGLNALWTDGGIQYAMPIR